jgi:hypothetical protein
MIYYAFAAETRPLEHLDVEKQHGINDQQIADAQRQLSVRSEGDREYRIGERHMQKKQNHVEDCKRDDQERERDQIHGQALSRSDAQKRATPPAAGTGARGPPADGSPVKLGNGEHYLTFLFAT